MYDKALRFTPKVSEFYVGKGDLLMKLHRFEEAKVNFELAVHYDPEEGESWYKLCNAHLQLGNREKAEACFRKVLSVNASHSNAALELASLLADGTALPVRLQEAEKL